MKMHAHIIHIIPTHMHHLVPPQPNDTTVDAGESFVLECTSAAPLTWYRGNDSVEGLLGHRTLCGGSTLLVTDERRVGNMEYHCVATSAYRVSISYAIITVTSKPHPLVTVMV